MTKFVVSSGFIALWRGRLAKFQDAGGSVLKGGIMEPRALAAHLGQSSSVPKLHFTIRFRSHCYVTSEGMDAG